MSGFSFGRKVAAVYGFAQTRTGWPSASRTVTSIGIFAQQLAERLEVGEVFRRGFPVENLAE